MPSGSTQLRLCLGAGSVCLPIININIFSCKLAASFPLVIVALTICYIMSFLEAYEVPLEIAIDHILLPHLSLRYPLPFLHPSRHTSFLALLPSDES